MTNQLENVYSLVDTISLDAISMASLIHFLCTYGGKISTDDWDQTKARFRGNVLRHAESTTALLDAIDRMKQPQ